MRKLTFERHTAEPQIADYVPGEMVPVGAMVIVPGTSTPRNARVPPIRDAMTPERSLAPHARIVRPPSALEHWTAS